MKKILIALSFQVLFIYLSASLGFSEYGIQVASSVDLSQSSRQAERLIRKNFKGFVTGPDSKGWYRICIGLFETSQEARTYKNTLAAQGFGRDIRVVRIDVANIVYPPAAERQAIRNSHNPAPPAAERQAIRNSHNPAPPAAEFTPVSAVQNLPDSGPREENPLPAMRQPPSGRSNKRDITLTWNANPGPDLAGYKIYYATDPPFEPAYYADEGPPPIIADKGATQITLHNLSANKNYHFSITAFNSQGIESEFSDAVNLQAAGSSREQTSKEASFVYAPPENRAVEPLNAEPSAVTVPGAARMDAIDRPGALSAGDIVEILVPGESEMSRTYDVDPEGDIYVTAIGKRNVHGLTIDGLNELLMKDVKKFLKKGDQLSLKIIDSLRFINIKGGVRYPGWYRVPVIATLDDLLDRAGGLLPDVNYTQIKLKRQVTDGFADVPLKEKITLFPNDVLEVPPPKVYQAKIDSGDLLFISIPSRVLSVGRTDAKETANLRDELTQNQVDVDQNGYINIPNYGSFYVNNLTPGELETVLTEKLPKYLARAAKVRVSIIEKKQFIQVMGQVANPGWYNIPEYANIQAALNSAGGPLDGAILSYVTINRKGALATRRLQVNLYQYIITGDDRLLTPLHAGDTVFVPISANFGNIKRTLMPWTPPESKLEQDTKKKARIFGAVNTPGSYEPTEDLDLLDLMVMAGGQTDDADLSKILIIRNGKPEFSFNLEAFLAGAPEQKIPRILHGDTVFINFIPKTTFEPKEDEVFYVLGKVMRPGDFKLTDQMTVPQAIALAGDFAPFANKERIMIVRFVKGKQLNIPVNFQKTIEGKYPEVNYFVQPNDTIYVP